MYYILTKEQTIGLVNLLRGIRYNDSDCIGLLECAEEDSNGSKLSISKLKVQDEHSFYDWTWQTIGDNYCCNELDSSDIGGELEVNLYNRIEQFLKTLTSFTKEQEKEFILAVRSLRGNR